MSAAVPFGAQSDLSASVRAAWAAVADADLPDEMQKIAFKEALRAALGSSAPRDSVAPQRTSHNGSQSSSGVRDDSTPEVSTVAEAEVLGKVSEGTGVPVEDLEQVLNIDNGTVKLLGLHTKYGSSTADQARAVAQIVTVVRNLGMGESDTSFDIIKLACESKHCYDSKNFASIHLPKIAGFVVRGEKRGRRLEARGPGIEAFAGLIAKVLGKEK